MDEQEVTPEITPEDIIEYQEQMKEQEEDTLAEAQEEQYSVNPELMEAYGGAPPELEVKNKDTFLHNAAYKSSDTLRTTFLKEEELGRPMFTVRFLLDLHDLSKYYIDPIIEEINKLNPKDKEKWVENRISQYIWEKVQNITASGMSNEGFLTNLTASRKLEISRRKYDSRRIENLKGGINKGK